MARRRRRRVRFRSPIQTDGLRLEWRWAVFLLPILGLVGGWFVSQYQIKQHEERLADQEGRLRTLEAQASRQDAMVLTRLESRQEQLLIDVAALKARLRMER